MIIVPMTMIVQQQHISHVSVITMLNSVYISSIFYRLLLSLLTFSFTFILLQGNKFEEAEEVFDRLLNDENSPLKPDQKMFNMMIYMFKKAGSYEKARKTFAQMAERGIEQSTVTYNSLMSFETNYKEVSNIYDQVFCACLSQTTFLSEG